MSDVYLPLPYTPNNPREEPRVLFKQRNLGDYVDRKTEADKAIQMFKPIFPGISIVLMAQDSRGVPTYYGRQDISQFMANIPIECVPFKEYTIS